MRHPRNNVARLPPMILLGIAHHVTQRGDRRERTFFEHADYAPHLDLLAEAADRHGVGIWSYCLGSGPNAPKARPNPSTMSQRGRLVINA